MNEEHTISRRRLLSRAAAGALGITLAGCFRDRGADKIEKADFGRTGHKSTRTLFGAYALAYVNQEDADRTLELLLEYGVNHIDTAPSYGSSELRLGPWMAKHRHSFFLATKTDQRTYQRAKRQIQHSLERLQVGQVDLLQLHNLVDPIEWDVTMGSDGALEAVIEAREQGLTRFIGVTGHGLTAPAMHMRSLERFNFHSVLLPFNYPLFRKPQYVTDFQALVRLCQERNVAVQIIKSVARRPWTTAQKRYSTWYEPLEDQVAIDKAIHWALAHDDVFLNTAGDSDILPMILDAARRFRSAPSDEDMQLMMAQLDMRALWT